MNNNGKKILGIDPGLVKTGFGIIFVKSGVLSFIDCGTIRTNPKDKMAERVITLHQDINLILAKYQPDEVAIEKTFININPESSLKLGHARGAIMLSIALHNKVIYEYSTTAVKKAVTGVGRADKNQIGAMIKYLLPKANYNSEDAADALAVAICHSNNTKSVFNY